VGVRFAGELKVKASQNIVGTSSTCLNLFSGSRREELRGTFAFVPAPAGADCDAFPTWPVRADEPERR
jgi:hypothetical protein